MCANEPERLSHAARPKRLYAPTECTGRGALSSGKGMDSRRAALDEVNGPRLPRVVGNRELGSRGRGLVLMLVLRGAPGQAAGGGRGGKLDSRVSRGDADGGVED